MINDLISESSLNWSNDHQRRLLIMNRICKPDLSVLILITRLSHHHIKLLIAWILSLRISLISESSFHIWTIGWRDSKLFLFCQTILTH